MVLNIQAIPSQRAKAESILREHMKHEIENWIEAGVLSTGVRVGRLPEHLAKSIVQKARARFVAGNPRAWWMSLSRKYEQFESTTYKLIDILPEKIGKCWFIPETQTTETPVYSMNVAELPTLLGACPYFEYYVVGVMFEWLVSESDHNIYFCVTEAVAARA